MTEQCVLHLIGVPNIAKYIDGVLIIAFELTNDKTRIFKLPYTHTMHRYDESIVAYTNPNNTDYANLTTIWHRVAESGTRNGFKDAKLSIQVDDHIIPIRGFILEDSIGRIAAMAPGTSFAQTLPHYDETLTNYPYLFRYQGSHREGLRCTFIDARAELTRTLELANITTRFDDDIMQMTTEQQKKLFNCGYYRGVQARLDFVKSLQINLIERRLLTVNEADRLLDTEYI